MPQDRTFEGLSPRQTPGDETKAAARAIILAARSASLAFLHPDTQTPFISRVSVAVIHGRLTTLVSDLSLHTRGLAQHPRAALLLGEVPAKGDALSAPRLSLAVHAEPTPPQQREALSASWLAAHPASQAYVGFADFRFLVFGIEGGSFVRGFAQAFSLTQGDIALP